MMPTRKVFKVAESVEIARRGLALFFDDDDDDELMPPQQRFKIRITRPDATIHQWEACLSFAKVQSSEVVSYVVAGAKREDVPPGSLVSIVDPENRDLQKSSRDIASTLRQEAEEQALALQFGFDDSEDAVEWADAHIAALDQPPHTLLEISLAGSSSRPDIVHLLRSLPGEADVPRACQLLITRMTHAWDKRDAKADRVSGALYGMYQAHLLNNAAAEEWARLDRAASFEDAGIDSDPYDSVIDVDKLLGLATELAASQPVAQTQNEGEE